MNINEYIVMSSNDGVITGGEDNNQTVSTEVQQDSNATVTPTSGNGISFWGLMGLYALFLVGMYYLISKPQKKKQAKIEEMQSQLQVGDDVITNNGFHGKIVDIEEKVIIVEFGINKGVRIPVTKSNVFKKTIDEETK